MSRYGRDVSAVNPKILRVARETSARLSDRGVAHALVGGLAVCARGYARATRDVDFLVEDSAREEIAGDRLGGEVEGKTVDVGGVAVDFLFPRSGEKFLNAAIRAATVVEGIPTIGAEVLIYLKMVAGRARDQGDVVELLKRGKVDVAKARAILRRRRPDLVEDFDAFVQQAEWEPR